MFCVDITFVGAVYLGCYWFIWGAVIYCVDCALLFGIMGCLVICLFCFGLGVCCGFVLWSVMVLF